MTQTIVQFTHAERKLIYFGVYNTKTQEESSSMSKNYGRAKYLHERMKADVFEVGAYSGFMLALINTDFSGWERTVLDGEYDTVSEAAEAKTTFINLVDDEMNYVGTHRFFVKGIKGNGKNPPNWSKKFNIETMTQAKIRQKIEFIAQSFEYALPDSIYTSAYLAIVAPESWGPWKFNYGSYEIVDLGSLFRFVRNFTGKDL